MRCVKKLKKNLRTMFYLYLIKLFEKLRKFVETVKDLLKSELLLGYFR